MYSRYHLTGCGLVFRADDLFPDITTGLNICYQRIKLGVFGVYREHGLKKMQRLLYPALQCMNISQFALGQNIVGNRLDYFLKFLLRFRQITLVQQESSEKGLRSYITGVVLEPLRKHSYRHLDVPGLLILFGKRHEELRFGVFRDTLRQFRYFGGSLFHKNYLFISN